MEKILVHFEHKTAIVEFGVVTSSGTTNKPQTDSLPNRTQRVAVLCSKCTGIFSIVLSFRLGQGFDCAASELFEQKIPLPLNSTVEL